MVVAKAGDGELVAREEDVMINGIFSDIVREILTSEDQKGAEDEPPKLKADWNGDTFELVSSDEGWQIEKKDAVVSGVYRFASPPQKIAVTDSDGDGDADVTVTFKDRKRGFIEGTEAKPADDPPQETDANGEEEDIDDADMDDLNPDDPLSGLNMDDENDLPARILAEPKPLAPLKEPAEPAPDAGAMPSKPLPWREFAARQDIADIIGQIGTIEGCADEQIKLNEQDVNNKQDVCAEFLREDLEKAAEAINAGIDFSLAPKKRIVNLPGDTVIGDKGTQESEGEEDELDKLLKETAKAAEPPPPKPRGKIILPPPPEPRQEEGPALSAPPPDKASFECDEFLPDIAKWKECMERPLKEADKFAQEAIDYFGKELTCPTTLEGVERLKDIVAEYDKNPSDFDPTPLMGFTPIEPYWDTQYHLPLMCGYNFSFKNWVDGINYYFLDKEQVASRGIIVPASYSGHEIFMRYLGITTPREHKMVYRKFGPNLFKQEYDSVGMPGTYDKDRIEKIYNDLPKGSKRIIQSGAVRFIPLTKDLYVYSSRDADGEIFLYGLLSIPKAERFLATACKQEIWRKDNPNDIQGEDETTAFDLGIALLLEKAEGLGELTDISKKLGDPLLALPAPTKARLMKRAGEINRTISLSTNDIVSHPDYAKALLEKHRGTSACRELGKRREHTH